MKSAEELVTEIGDGVSLKSLIKQACKKFINMNPNPQIAKLYNKDGVLLLEEDIGLIAPNDILYLALKGK